MKDPVSNKEVSEAMIEKAAVFNSMAMEEIETMVKSGEIVILKSGKILRRGYTTGTCASAASKAAVVSLLGIELSSVSVLTPVGLRVTLTVNKLDSTSGVARYSVIKDAGDDIDATNGAEIVAEVWFDEGSGIEINGGEGVGKVKKRGLPVPVGESAINPIPLNQIRGAVMEGLQSKMSEMPVSGSYPQDRRVMVKIEVPTGKKIAEKTLNPRLGIEGGISILGTTGFVEPFSLSAYDSSLILQLSILRAEGYKTLVIATGATSERIAVKMLKIPRIMAIRAGIRLELVLKTAAKEGFENVVIFGLPAKMVKIAAGWIATPLYKTPMSQKLVADCLSSISESISEEIKRIEAVSIGEMLAHLEKADAGLLEDLFRAVSKRASLNCSKLLNGIEVASAIVSRNGEVLGCDKPLKELMEVVK